MVAILGSFQSRESFHRWVAIYMISLLAGMRVSPQYSNGNKNESKPEVTCKMPWYPTRKNVKKNAIFLILFAVNLRVIQWSLKLELSISDFISVGRSHAWLPLMRQHWTGSGRVCRTLGEPRWTEEDTSLPGECFDSPTWRRWMKHVTAQCACSFLLYFIAVIGKLKARILLAIGQDFPFKGFYKVQVFRYIYLTNSNTVHQHIV